MRTFLFIILCGSVFIANVVSQTAISGSIESIERTNELPRVLIIGDSVSLGYFETVSQLLAGKAKVFHNPGSARNTKFGLRNLEKWLGEEDWDAIYVNWGLDDIYIHDPVPNPKGNYGEEGGINTLSMEYEDRLNEMAGIFADQQVPVIWATTTPVPPNSMDQLLRHWGGGDALPEHCLRWFPQHVESYNRIAQRVMRQYGIYVHDLHSEIAPVQSKLQRANSPYFTEPGNRFLGKIVSDYIWELIRPSLQVKFSEDVVTILDTDIGPWLDIDDWFDVLMYSITDLDHGGIIMEHYASDWEEAALKKFLEHLGKESIPFARGLQKPLHLSEDGSIQPSSFEDGANLILETMRHTDKLVRIICVGALSNAALAYHKNPDLFKQKIEAIWFCGGMLNGYENAHSAGRWDTNIHRDQLAADIIFNNDIPLVWFPVSLELIVKSTRDQEKSLAEINHPAMSWLYEGIDYWHERRGKLWEQQTQQGPGEGRRLWSMTIHSAMNENTQWNGYRRGRATFSRENWSEFMEDPDGPDLLMVKLDEKKISHWYVEFIKAYFKESAQKQR